ncbi:hypothetical protein HKBW3S09_01607 [Candidatus Hakubella thermalkaliphila]|uniref:Transposase IS204/IS1001/IS1096/IS1165 DDE domain-containing protein n=1 Tax=Candidatus Hakubella thermalkaliphila TaxID=2754717 RepID=A0A6V8NY14_9ACTN|nr:hypothetical protein HKBW3S09_01607 [Candidatus Hakubella thermalkaliphila]
MDMWEPYMNAVETVFPEADIVHDKFHISRHMGEAVTRSGNHLLRMQDTGYKIQKVETFVFIMYQASCIMYQVSEGK